MKIFISFVFLLLCMLSNVTAQQQSLSDSLKQEAFSNACFNIRLLSCPSCQSEAYSVFLNYGRLGDAQSMYQLYQCLLNGWGVEKNSLEAITWLEKAAQSHSEVALTRLVTIYKKGLGIPYDLKKACQYAQILADLGNPNGFYQYGYFLYKGLGCYQNYEESMRYFKQGALVGHGPSMYMLGLGYRNGYGLAIDMDAARNWLSKAADKGIHAAIQELQTPDSENKSILVRTQTVPESIILPNIHETVLHQWTDDITGCYSGKLATYDWSGKHLIENENLSMKVVLIDERVKINWLINGEEIITLGELSNDSLIIFDEVTYQKLDRYNSDIPRQCQFVSATLTTKLIDGKLYVCGNLQQYSPELMEKEKPMCFIAEKKTTDIFCGETNNITNLQISPNPFRDDFCVSFTLSQPEICHISFYSLMGIKVLDKSLGYLNEGNHSFNFTPNIDYGTYFFWLSYGGNMYLSKIVNKIN